MIDFKYPFVLYGLIPVVILLFIIMRRNFVRFDDFRDQVAFSKDRRWKRVFLFFSRLAIFSLLIIAIAQPYEPVQVFTDGKPALTIMVDKSRSFELFSSNISERLAADIGRQMPVNVVTIADGNKSSLGDSILAGIHGDDNVLLITDGNNNDGRSLGDVMLLASSLNTTISALDISPVKGDAAVYLDGPSETTADSENEFEVGVRQSGNVQPYGLKVYFDSELVIDQAIDRPKVITFGKKLKEGYHRITAEIDANDYFRENNRFLKVVKVQPKPRIFFLSANEPPAKPIFSKIYDVSYGKELPDDLSSYSALVIDDIKAGSLPVKRLTDYVLDGNGLFVIGGKNSFDKDDYKSPDYPLYEALLPVSVGSVKAEFSELPNNIVILIDISDTSGFSFNSGSEYRVYEVEKALAISILNDIGEKDNVAVIAFESEPHVVSELSRLTDKVGLEDKIKRLNYGGGTYIEGGLKAAIDPLKYVRGNKNIILISDGQGTNDKNDLEQAGNAAFGGMKLYTVGVGKDTNRKHMIDLAQQGNGAYFEPQDTERIKLLIRRQLEVGNDTYDLHVVNGYHFITNKLNIKGSVSGYNSVVPKSQAQLLVMSGLGHPILSVWRFGLGRIAVLSTDDGSAWNGGMLSRENSAIMSRTTNWVIGDLSRNKDFDVRIDDIYLGEDLGISVVSKSTPSSSNLNFSKIGENAYSAGYTPKEAGFYKFFDAVAAVNYNRELGATGMSPDLKRLVQVTRGAMFEPGDVEGIISKVKQDSKRAKSDSSPYAWAFVLAAICLFLAEIAVRRAFEAKRINKQ
ncbi:VWA domain-containing protein [Candidatus Woesearchaeota archaeon]|nr:VWA domain-containing protein [Candidatus Woesearchaeota archaeon]